MDFASSEMESYEIPLGVHLAFLDVSGGGFDVGAGKITQPKTRNKAGKLWLSLSPKTKRWMRFSQCSTPASAPVTIKGIFLCGISVGNTKSFSSSSYIAPLVHYYLCFVCASERRLKIFKMGIIKRANIWEISTFVVEFIKLS